MKRSLTMAACVAVSVSAAWAQERPRKLPAVRPITREVLEEAAERRRAGIPEPELEESYKTHFEAYMVRLDALLSMEQNTAVPNREDAAALIDMLYEEMNEPELNGRWQLEVVRVMGEVASRPGTEAETIGLLRTGLLNYAAEGGGKSSPGAMVEFATALAIVGGPAYPECDALAAKLSAEAAAWAEELRSEIFLRIVSEERERLDRILRSGTSTVQQTPAERALAGSRPQHAEQAVRMLALGKRPTVESVARATRLATVDFGKPALNEDLISRLLLAYRTVLERREGVSKEVVRAIDERLLWLARDSGKLTTPRHWELWADAVIALGGVRASRELERYVLHDAPKGKAEPLVARELERAGQGLRETRSARPLPPTTSQPAATTRPAA